MNHKTRILIALGVLATVAGAIFGLTVGADVPLGMLPVVVGVGLTMWFVNMDSRGQDSLTSGA